VILYSVELAQAGDELQINQALSSQKVVTLQSGVYNLEDSIIINDGNQLIGKSDTILLVKSHFFTGNKAIISSNGIVNDILIGGFQIDGNCDAFDSGLASTPGHAHDNEQAIKIVGSTGQFCNNITIRDMTISDCFGDGVHIRFAKNVHCYSNFIQNCQHEGIFWTCVINGLAEFNKIAGITSDCLRCDNCISNIIQNNYFFSYTGDHNNNAPKGYNKGIQIADAGSSKGYNANNKPTSTKDIIVRWNTFANCGTQAVWLDSTGKGYDNVYIYDNKFIGVAAFVNNGHNITLNITASNESSMNYNDLTGVITPTLEMSERIFSNIFDILDLDFSESAKTNQTADTINYTVQETPKGKIAGGIKIVGFKDVAVIDNQQYIESNESILIKSSVIRNPTLNSWSGGIQKSKKDIKTAIINGTAYANMTVKTSWYSLKTSSISGKKVKSNIKTSVYTFSDAFSPAPEVIEQPENITGIIYVYPTSFLIRVPSKNLVKINYEYDGNITEHLLLTGIRNQTDTGVIYTEYSRINRWTGELEHQGDWVNVLDIFDKTKLNVTVETPYKEVKVDKFEIKVSKFPQRAIAGWFYPFIAALLILFFYIKWLHSDLKKY
jgi:hypothetical protein